MVKTVRVSTIIRKARDKYLWDGTDINYKGSIFSCHAIEDSIYSIQPSVENKIFNIVKKYGCDIYSNHSFNEFKTDELIQGARFLWLSFLIEATKNVKIKL
jgi:hypothetical protein